MTFQPTEANQIISPKVTKIVNRCKGHKLVFASVRDTVLFSFHEINIYILHQVLHRLQNKEKPIRTTFTLRFGSLKMIFECSIARCDVGLGRAIVQCQKNPLRKPKLSINRAILSAHFSAVKFCIGFFCWIGFFLVLHRLFL